MNEIPKLPVDIKDVSDEDLQKFILSALNLSNSPIRQSEQPPLNQDEQDQEAASRLRIDYAKNGFGSW